MAREKEETRSKIPKYRRHSILSFYYLYFINHQLISRHLEWTSSSLSS